MKKYNILLILFIASTVTANTINLTIENKNTGICLTTKNLSDYVCNTTEIMQLSGTADHQMIIIPKPYLSTSTHDATRILDFATTLPTMMLTSFWLFLACMFLTIPFVWIVTKGMRGGR